MSNQLLPGSHQGATSTGVTTQVNGLQSIRESIRQRNISEKATSIIMQSWTGTTQKQYKHHVEMWSSFCGRQQIDPHDPPVGKFLDFLVTLYEKGFKYSAINTARSAVSARFYNKPVLGEGSFAAAVLNRDIPRD
jgi:hypothetical protein